MKMRFVQTLLGVAWLTATLWSPALADSMPGMQMGPPPLKITQTAGPYRLTLVMLPAEPYYTAAQVKSEHIHEGMLVIAGATPVQKTDPSRPNHHLVVHVYNRTSGEALAGAHVVMTYASTVNPGHAVPIPVVEMQAIGAGQKSTHYGNNVTLPPGTYRVNVTVNGRASTAFTIKAT